MKIYVYKYHWYNYIKGWTYCFFESKKAIYERKGNEKTGYELFMIVNQK